MILIGPHRLLLGDITTGAVSTLMGTDLADVVYSDPPWGPGNQKYWHTMNGSEPRTDWLTFIAEFCGAVAAHRKPDAPVFVEMGLRWVTDLDRVMAAVGLQFQRRWEISYGPRGKPLPNALSLYGPHDVAIEIPDAHGEPATRTILTHVVRPGSIVLDPCTGLGMTARITQRLGGAFRGTELNPARLSRTVENLHKVEVKAALAALKGNTK